ncbi:hypothetical protein LEP1GSC008_1426 [Leptospira kirschneri serovar Bulgarica str. Nikolaevo]|uniref:Uncharacterized protein n=1 Tax=Leptospira kirschneri serovar Bulgarica str. Nikolaevo TaxID=1240687 RepID=M6FHW9_9LEPT|nr:hypothetical protein LEP1GSC008_1426 [Leptospira kirschneri serovar Bulgarica str. Nikolaevo]
MKTQAERFTELNVSLSKCPILRKALPKFYESFEVTQASRSLN